MINFSSLYLTHVFYNINWQFKTDVPAEKVITFTNFFKKRGIQARHIKFLLPIFSNVYVPSSAGQKLCDSRCFLNSFISVETQLKVTRIALKCLLFFLLNYKPNSFLFYYSFLVEEIFFSMFFYRTILIKFDRAWLKQRNHIYRC